MYSREPELEVWADSLQSVEVLGLQEVVSPEQKHVLTIGRVGGNRIEQDGQTVIVIRAQMAVTTFYVDIHICRRGMPVEVDHGSGRMAHRADPSPRLHQVALDEGRGEARELVRGHDRKGQIELDPCITPKNLSEVTDQADIGTSEAVDRLPVVAYRKELQVRTRLLRGLDQLSAVLAESWNSSISTKR